MIFLRMPGHSNITQSWKRIQIALMFPHPTWTWCLRSGWAKRHPTRQTYSFLAPGGLISVSIILRNSFRSMILFANGVCIMSVYLRPIKTWELILPKWRAQYCNLETSSAEPFNSLSTSSRTQSYFEILSRMVVPRLSKTDDLNLLHSLIEHPGTQKWWQNYFESGECL